MNTLPSAPSGCKRSLELQSAVLTLPRDYVLAVDTLLSDPSTSYWLRQAIRDLSVRDIVDATQDAETLCALVQLRLAEMQAVGGTA